MNYIGSKLKLKEWIKQEVTSVTGELQNKVFCDLFAGTATVGRAFKKDVKKVIANDVEYYSYILNKNYIQNHTPLRRANELIDELNSLKPKEGFIYKNYCLGSGSGRQYFSDFNGKKIDAIRQKIQEWFENKAINENEYFFLLASLLESADKVANTASVYGAFLKYLKKTAQKEMELKPAFFEINTNEHQVFQEDANKLIQHTHGDILYLDPPYNHRQYGANYHLLNTIAKYNVFQPKGRSGINEYFHSNYCKKSKALQSFHALIKDANFTYIFLSYNNEGLIDKHTIKEVMSQYGNYTLVRKKHPRFHTSTNLSKNDTYEYLHILIKDKNGLQ
jgi:adenine-specific DNA-methyltransferase